MPYKKDVDSRKVAGVIRESMIGPSEEKKLAEEMAKYGLPKRRNDDEMYFLHDHQGKRCGTPNFVDLLWKKWAEMA